MDNSFLDKDYIQEISVSSAIQENADRILELEKQVFDLNGKIISYDAELELESCKKQINTLRSLLCLFYAQLIIFIIVLCVCFGYRIDKMEATTPEPTTVVSATIPETTVTTTKAKVETTKAIEETTTKKQSHKNVVNYFDVSLSKDLQNHIFHLCANYEINPAVVIAMIERESNFKAKAIGDNGESFGLMQIQPKWKENQERMQRLNCTDLLDPYQNVTVGIDILAGHLDKGKGLTWALMAYNSGASKANQHAKNGVVTDYARDVIARSEKISGQKG